MSKLAELIALSQGQAGYETSSVDLPNDIYNIELVNVLAEKNGFYAFKNALHVYGVDYLIRWNDFCWANNNWETSHKPIFFSEDIFGMQFCFNNNVVCQYDAESGEFETIGTSLEQWAKYIIDDPNFTVGQQFATDWEKLFGAIPQGKRLGAKIPFVLGGDYKTENFYLADSYELASFRNDLRKQIENLPNGTPINLKTI